MSGFSRFCVGAVQSGAGKTTIVMGLLAALKRRGLRVQPFKCGPDYIDAGHHRRTCGRASRNLDPWMMGEDAVRRSFARAVADADVAVIEGVMGLFDGARTDSSEGSTAHVARLVNAPVVLVVPAGGMARSIAAMVKGYVDFESRLSMAGVIANSVNTDHHRDILRDALCSAALPPLLGVLPCDSTLAIPERHLGLMADTETGIGDGWYERLADAVEKHIDLDALLAAGAGTRPPPMEASAPASGQPVRLGVARDAAFHFYYEDNLDMLRSTGFELVEFSPLADSRLPSDLHGLYIGGGFPEMFAARLEANVSMRSSVRDFAARGGAVYAECGGLMYLCSCMTAQDGESRSMCGVLPYATRMGQRLHRLGYVEATTRVAGPFGPAGTRLRGHEFHWSFVEGGSRPVEPVYSLKTASGAASGEEGYRRGRVWASYVHLHFASCPGAVMAWRDYLREGVGLSVAQKEARP
jgi:cobyrinic acid a,c-diamide synthase